MTIRKTLIAGAALAVAIAFSPLSDLSAATFVNPGSQPGTDNLTQVVKMKKGKMRMMHHRKHRMGKRAKSKGPGRCGMTMYWKKGRCMDATKK
jgi:hypothetical protein